MVRKADIEKLIEENSAEDLAEMAEGMGLARSGSKPEVAERILDAQAEAEKAKPSDDQPSGDQPSDDQQSDDQPAGVEGIDNPDAQAAIEREDAVREATADAAEPGTPASIEAVDIEGEVTDSDDDAVKRDDQGAIDQLQAAKETEAAFAAAGPSAPYAPMEPTSVVSVGGEGSLEIRQGRVDGDAISGDVPVGVAHELFLFGEGFPRGEVQLDVIRMPRDGDDGERWRFAAMVERGADEDPESGGRISMQLTPLNRPGDFEVVAYYSEERVGENEATGKRLMRETDRVRATIIR